jgi:hypothetical protein
MLCDSVHSIRAPRAADVAIQGFTGITQLPLDLDCTPQSVENKYFSVYTRAVRPSGKAYVDSYTCICMCTMIETSAPKEKEFKSSG